MHRLTCTNAEKELGGLTNSVGPYKAELQTVRLPQHDVLMRVGPDAASVI